MSSNSRSLSRRRVYLGEGLTFEIQAAEWRLEAEAIDVTSEGLGLAVSHAPGAARRR